MVHTPEEDTIEVETDYVTKSEMQTLVDSMDALRQGLETLFQKKSKKTVETKKTKKTKKLRDTDTENSNDTGSDKDKDSDKDSNNESDNDSQGSRKSTRSIKLSDHILQNLYNNIPRYDGEGDVQKLYDFIDKVDSYLNIANLDDNNIELNVITVKLTGTTSLW